MPPTLVDIHRNVVKLRAHGDEVNYLVLTPETIYELQQTDSTINAEAMGRGKVGRAAEFDIKQGNKDMIITKNGMRIPINEDKGQGQGQGNAP